MSVLSTKVKLLLGGIGVAGAVGTGVYFGGGLKLFSSSKNQVTSPSSTSATTHSTNQVSHGSGQSDGQETTRSPHQPKITCRKADGGEMEMEYPSGLQVDENMKQLIERDMIGEDGQCINGDFEEEDED